MPVYCVSLRGNELYRKFFLVMVVSIVWKLIPAPLRETGILGGHMENGENVCREVHMHPSKLEICSSYWELHLVAD